MSGLLVLLILLVFPMQTASHAKGKHNLTKYTKSDHWMRNITSHNIYFTFWMVKITHILVTIQDVQKLWQSWIVQLGFDRLTTWKWPMWAPPCGKMPVHRGFGLSKWHSKSTTGHYFAKLVFVWCGPFHFVKKIIGKLCGKMPVYSEIANWRITTESDWIWLACIGIIWSITCHVTQLPTCAGQMQPPIRFQLNRICKRSGDSKNRPVSQIFEYLYGTNTFVFNIPPHEKQAIFTSSVPLLVELALSNYLFSSKPEVLVS